MKVKYEEGKVVMEGIEDLGVNIELREVCKEHSIADTFRLRFVVDLNFCCLVDDDNEKSEGLIALDFLNFITNLDGCVEKGVRHKITIEEYKENSQILSETQ